jgi:hypothetical protein
MLQCYVLMCARSVTAFLAPPRSQRPGQEPRSPHPKAGHAHDLLIKFIKYVWQFLHVSALLCHPQGAFLVPSERCAQLRRVVSSGVVRMRENPTNATIIGSVY